MRIKRIRTNQELMNKLNGKLYRVTDVTEKDGVKTGKAAMIDEETGEVIAENEVTVTDENSICFRIVNDPNPPVIPEGFTVKDGILNKNGETVEQGEIRVKRIVAKIPGVLVLAVVPADEKEGHIDLYTYEPERDRFRKCLSYSIPDVQVICNMDDDLESVILGFTKTHMEDKKDEKGEVIEQVEVFDNCAVIMINAKAASIAYPGALLSFDKESVKYLAEKQNFYFLSEKEVTEGGVIIDGRSRYYAMHADYVLNYVESYVTEEPAEVTVCHLNKQPFFHGKNILKLGNGEAFIKHSSISQLEGYNYLVDLQITCYEVTMTLADKDFNVKKITQKSTKDRGYVVTIE